MAHKDRKINKKRGTRTCGWGGAQKHRGAGSRGGRGMGGTKKHKKSWILKYDPDHFSEKGFKRPRAVLKDIKVINVGRVDELLNKWVEGGYVSKEGDKYAIDLSTLGYDKLLGSGKVEHPMQIKVNACTGSAKEKVEGAGGEVKVNVD